MKRVSVESSVIAEVGYDRVVSTMEILFTTGELYRYFAVPPSVHRGLVGADSPGEFFGRRIRDVYPFEHVRLA
ncbi:KTSC domain-containing protein [Microbacterium rhizophilus]|uniref:KTSC domain-containing protein n=1 Tax=Microbacterium rhizophilus TaxID=3138934 RepID=UPI0031F17529